MSSDARVGLAEARRPPRPSLGGAERLVGSPPMVAQARRKVPVVQLFLNLEGLPRCRMRVAVLGDGNMELAGTRPSERLDPMFEEHLELFGNAAGKDSSQLLTFVVQHVGPGERWREATIRTIATAHIASDELRRAGHNNPHEGAAVPLPLRLVEDAWPEGAPPHASLSYGDQRQPARPTLHCYVHAGYHYQSSRRHSFGASPRRSISGGVDEAPEHSPRASMAMPSRRPILELAYACTPGGGSTRALVLHLAELRVGYAIEPLSFSEDDEGEGIGDGEPAQGAVAGAVAASSSGPRVRSVQPFPVGLERAARDSVVLRWRLLALTAGYVPLPALTLHKLPNAAEPGVGVGQGIELPMPAYLMGSTVLVAAKDAVVEVV
ncbi:hypothetical protein Ctob_016107 [Chrysochromulina tobinii]|uniref:Uncharacterized protein n=1 Tax=Chrysochromulina tobinii TaxID=1460289 RepID=A0A0M0KAS9_9EUKA|nr:hypothetical protein Ctob_016107 [Chrysochromulina tobinii]|eukprot:KOO35904.1 hypothetical protein Ctob_016107 [Chrysochromulina sp. CCMP291]